MDGGTSRLFVALPVPPDVAANLKKLPQKGLDGRWSAVADYHITLRFLGDLDEGRLTDIVGALSSVRRSSFHVELAGLGSFSLKRQTILWASVQSTRKMTALAGDINEALGVIGFEMPNKPFTPHVTLARLKSAHGLDTYIARNQTRVKASWQATDFTLYRSGEAEAGDGGRYKALHSFALR